MTERDRELLIEQVVSAWREPDVRGDVRASPAWYDLDEADRVIAYDETVKMRRIEAALDPDGLTTTAHAVLAAIQKVD